MARKKDVFSTFLVRFCAIFWQRRRGFKRPLPQPVEVPVRFEIVNFFVNPEKLHGFSCTHYYTGVSVLANLHGTGAGTASGRNVKSTVSVTSNPFRA